MVNLAFVDKAICLPDKIFERCQLDNLTVKLPRMGWDEEFTCMAKCGDDKLLDNPTPTK